MSSFSDSPNEISVYTRELLKTIHGLLRLLSARPRVRVHNRPTALKACAVVVCKRDRTGLEFCFSGMVLKIKTCAHKKARDRQ